MRIPSGTTDQVIYFVAVDATDFTTRETGLSSFTVYRSRNGAAAAVMAATITEVSSANMPGLYKLLLDDDMDIAAGNDSEEMVFHITHAGMAPVTRAIELYRPKITLGNTASVESDGDLTKVNTLDGHTAQTGDSFARLGAPDGASVSADIAALPTQADITGGAYALDTDANGRIRVVDGTGTGEIDTASGVVKAQLADAVTHGGSTANLTLQTVLINRTSSFAAVSITNAGGGPAIQFINSNTGPAVFCQAATAPPIRINAAEAGDDIVLYQVNGSTVAKIDMNGAFTGNLTGTLSVCTTNTDMRGTDDALLASDDGSGLTEAGGDGDHLTAINLPNQTMDITGNLSGSVGSVTGNVGGNVTGSVGSLATQAKADVNAEADTAISDAALATSAALATVDTVVDAIKVITDALGATAAARLKLSAGQIIPGTVDTVTNTHTPTTTEFQADDITEATADHFNGRIVVFTSGALAGQATDITDYEAVGGIGQLTVTALTEAPANNDTFIIV